MSGTKSGHIPDALLSVFSTISGRFPASPSSLLWSLANLRSAPQQQQKTLIFWEDAVAVMTKETNNISHAVAGVGEFPALGSAILAFDV